MKRMLVSSGSPYEPTIGFSRAVRVGPHIAVSGTGPVAAEGGTAGVGDAYAQAKRCLEIIKAAIEEAGGDISHVTRTRMMITDAAVWQDVAKAHGEMFTDIRPAATIVVVIGFVNPEWLVEIEADCIVE